MGNFLKSECYFRALLQYRSLLRSPLVLSQRMKKNTTWSAQLQEQVGAGCTPPLCNAPTSAFCPIHLLSVTFCSSLCPDVLEMACTALLPTSLPFPAHAPAAGGRKQPCQPVPPWPKSGTASSRGV